MSVSSVTVILAIVGTPRDLMYLKFLSTVSYTFLPLCLSVISLLPSMESRATFILLQYLSGSNLTNVPLVCIPHLVALIESIAFIMKAGLESGSPP
jgi:hypothetical protein